MTEDRLTIRAYSLEEELSLDFYELAAQSFVHGAPWTLQQYAETLADSQLNFFVAESEEEIVGYVGGKLLFNEAEIYSVAVNTSYQGRQVATRLVRAFMEYCEKQGVTTVFLEVRESNVPGRTLYEKLNFTVIGKRPDYYTHPVEDAILMKCTIGKLEHDEQ